MNRRTHFMIVSTQSVLLMVGLWETVAAVNCFSCNYSSTSVEVTSTCGNAPSSVSSNSSCSGSLCRITWAEYSAPSNTFRDHDCATTARDNVHAIEQCEGTGVDNKTYFVYQNQCCYSTGKVTNYGTAYSITECYCQTDYCNGVTNIPSTTAPTNSSDQPMNYSTTAGQSRNNSSSIGHSMNYTTTVDHGFVTTSSAAWQQRGNRMPSSATHWVSVIVITVLSIKKV